MSRNHTTAFEPRVALASLSGEADAEWAIALNEHVGAAVIGGIALDELTREAARTMVERDREEFLPDDPLTWIDSQLAALADEPLQAGVNVRATSPGRVRDAAEICARHEAFVEINAHCRQEEMCAVGSGESLLHEPDRLRKQVRAADRTGAAVSVKVRTELEGVDLPAVAAQASTAGADVIHVDAMDSERVVADVVAAVDAFVIANNGVRDRETAREYLEYGAEAVSVARASDDPDVLERVREATAEWFATAEGSV